MKPPMGEERQHTSVLATAVNAATASAANQTLGTRARRATAAPRAHSTVLSFRNRPCAGGDTELATGVFSKGDRTLDLGDHGGQLRRSRFSPLSSPPFIYGNLHLTRSERSPLRIVFAENEPEGARTEGSGDGEMKSRRAAIVADDWHGEFGSYDEWATLGPQPPYRTATFFDAHGRRCITQHDFARARDDRAFPLRYRWERTEPRKRR